MIKCYRDANGFPRVEADTEERNLAAFLEQDVQRSEGIYDEFRAAIDAVTEKETEWSLSGNAHKVTMANDRVVIENLWDDDLDPTVLSISEFASALHEWRRFLGSQGG